MRVWIDQDLCTGDGLCEEICPQLFFMGDDGLAYVKEADWSDAETKVDGEPRLQGSSGCASIPAELLDAAVEAAEDCPGECIFIDA